MAKVRVIIADDHAIVLAGVRAMLQREFPEIHIIGEAHNGPMLLDLLARENNCDVVVTDFSMPAPEGRDYDGIPLLQMLHRRHPGLRVVVLTMIENPALLQAMLETGIHGLVDKVSSTPELLQAVRSAAAGKHYLSQEVRALLAAGEGNNLLRKLSPHEAEVVRLFVQGLTVTEIAGRLSRSVKTISRQKSDAMRKLGLDNHSQLYAYAREHGMTS